MAEHQKTPGNTAILSGYAGLISAETNAKFMELTLAVNQDLVAALREIASIEPEPLATADMVPTLWGKLNHAMKTAEAALAKAEVK